MAMVWRETGIHLDELDDLDATGLARGQRAPEGGGLVSWSAKRKTESGFNNTRAVCHNLFSVYGRQKGKSLGGEGGFTDLGLSHIKQFSF